MDKKDYHAGAAHGAHIEKSGKKWTLALVREVKHSPEKVWQALTDPAHIREWAPFDATESLDAQGKKVKLKWSGAPFAAKVLVNRAEAPLHLELEDLKWELERLEDGTRIKLFHNIGKNYIAMGAAGWHICIDVLDMHLAGTPMGRIVGKEAWNFTEWQRLLKEYEEQFK